MNTTSANFVPPRVAGIYESFHQFGMWGDIFKGDINFNLHNSKFDNQYEDTWQGTVGTSNRFEQEAMRGRRTDKIQRRLAQNREAARKSRLRKKAYVQQLETSRLKLIELEQELNRARQQGSFVGDGVDAGELGLSEAQHPEIAAFEMEYGQWVEEQNRQVTEFRTALDAQINGIELRMLVDGGMSHYFELFRKKSIAAKADVFYMVTGMWKTSAERFFLWIGGFRPSDLLKVLLPHLDPLTEQQLLDVCNLKQSCQQAEDALSQGMDKLQQMLVESVAAGKLRQDSHTPQMTSVIDRLEAVVSFLNQADHLRQEMLLQMNRILTSRQAARGLLAIGEYFQRLRALSSLWATRPPEPPHGTGVDQT